MDPQTPVTQIDAGQSIVKQEDGTVDIVQTQEVSVENFTQVSVEQEMTSLQEELDSFDLIQSRRKQFLEDRIAVLTQVQKSLNS